MMIPGNQARLNIGRSAYDPSWNLAETIRFRFRRINLRARVPRLDATNSEGLPGAVRAANWEPIRGAPVPPAAIFAGSRYPTFSEYPYESQVPGVGVTEIEVEQVTWDFDQIIYQWPISTNPIMPGRHVSMIVIPNAPQSAAARFCYVFPHVYIEEGSHRMDIKDLQPVTFTGFTGGPWIYPMSTSPGLTFPSPHVPVLGAPIPVV